MMKKVLAGAVAALAFSATVQAGDFSYKYFEGGLIGTSHEKADTSGFILGAGYAFTDELFVEGSYSEREANEATPAAVGNDKTHYETTTVGFGANLPISRMADFVLTASHRKHNNDFDSIPTSYSSNLLTAGVRAELPMGTKTELEVNVVQQYLKGESESGLEASLRTYVAKDYSLSIGYTSIDKFDTGTLTLRKDM